MNAQPDRHYCTRCGKDGHTLAYCKTCPTCDGNGTHAEKLSGGDPVPRNVRDIAYFFAVHCVACHGTGLYKWQPPTGVCVAPCCNEARGKWAVSPRETWHDQPLPEPQTLRVTRPAAPRMVRVATRPASQTVRVGSAVTHTTDPNRQDMGLVANEQ